MKKILQLMALLVLVQANVKAQYPDLPGGGGAYNIQTLPTGSYVIAMDNKNQGDGTTSFTVVINNRQCTYGSGVTVLTCTNTAGILVGMQVTGHASIPAGATVLSIIPNTSITISLATTQAKNNQQLDFGYLNYTADGFNLKVYGLLVTLLNNNIHLKWVIKPGKALDAVDFSVNATKVKPTLGSAAAYDFAAGPFVIFQSDTAGVAALVQTYNNAVNPDVFLYKTNAPVSVDIRYDYLINGVIWKPKGAILNDGGNASIHSGYMTTASVPTGNYTIETTPAFVTGCYTFACEPHNTSAPAAVIQGIRTFVTNGGNFLAECAAVRTYELSTDARFQSTNGFDNANENGDPTTWNYFNTDLSYFQVNGYFGIADEGGSLKDWVIPSSPTNPPTNNFHYFTKGTKNARDYTNASASKLKPSGQLGGMVFYLGSHSYSGSNDYDVNGQRMFMNAFLTPTDPQGSLQSSAVTVCASFPNNIKVNCGSTSGPTAAYPLTFTLYEDLPPAGYNVGDIQLGNIVTFTGPNVALAGISQITAPALLNSMKNYVVAIRPNSGCLQPKYIQSFCSTLPVDLVSFTAKRANGSLVNLKWTTATEINNKGFYIERVVGSGTDWQTIGFVNSQALNGNSSGQLTYTFNDANNFNGVTQYRLRQVDLNEKIKFSEIRSVRGEDQKGKMIVYPNPSNDGRINVVFDDANVVRDIAVIDMSGRMVKQMKGISNNNVQIENLVPGVYTIRVVVPATGDQTVEKFVVNKR